MNASENNSQIYGNERGKILSFTFTGKGSEYFQIWLVNKVLQIITLGLYYPWALIRERKYLYQNTYLDHVPFDFTANPARLFKGYLIQYLVIVVWYVGNIVFQENLAWGLFSLLLLILLLISIPLLVWLTIRFRLRYIEWKGASFQFRASPLAFYGFYLIYSSFFLFPVLGPMLYAVFMQFLFEHISWGTLSFSCNMDKKKLIGAQLLFYLILFIAIFFLITLFRSDDLENMTKILSLILIYFLLFLALLLYGAYHSYLLLKGIKVGEAEVAFSMSFEDYFTLHFIGIMGILFTFGLAYPFVKIYLIKRVLSSLSIRIPSENYFEVAVQEKKEVTPVGELLLSDDFDIGIRILPGL
jgi:uncharacterized membrane protein YjgN (DUF898 family)